MTEPVIVARNLTKSFRTPTKQPGLRGAITHLFRPRYEDKVAVQAIDLSIAKGESVAYVGPNGAGKSTTLKMLTGILVPTSGEIYVNNLVPYKQRIENNHNIGVVFGQRTQLWWDLPVQESFRLLGDIYEVSEATFTANMNEFIEVLELESLLGKSARHLSLGQRMRCDLAASLLHSPAILFLDEPTIGLDVAVKARIRDFIKRINHEREVTILLTSHDLGDIEDTCRRLVMINQGQIVYDGSFQSIKQQFGRNRVLRILLKEPIETARITALQALSHVPSISIEQPELHQLVIQFDMQKSTAGAIINTLWSILPISDLQTEEASIEYIIRQLYEGQLHFEESMA
jgi:ABC-2 type transport system ATP-binding protein